MPPPTAAQLALIKRFEPILFFHPGERFFPSDAKRYLEHCALTQGAAPVIAAGKLAAVASEAQTPGDFLGRKLPNGKFEFLEDTPANKDLFLDLAGWKAETTELPGLKRLANLDAIAARYASATDPLNASQFWYHAEVFDKAKISALLADDVAKGGKDLGKLITTPEEVGKLTNPILICYYLFFPGHDEGLPGCEGVAVAQDFASFAGEWGCVAVLLDGPGPNGPFTPRFTGLSMRNVGVPVREDGVEVRVGMRIFSWNALELEPLTEHPRLAVAQGSHGLYLPSEPPGVVKAFTTDDAARNSCGLAAPVAAAMDGTENVTAPPFLMPPGANVTRVIKIFSAMAGGGLIGLLGGLAGALLGAGVGAIVGALWQMGESPPNSGSSATSPSPPPIPGPVTDTVPTTTAGPTAGKVAHPVGLVPSGVTPDRSQPWRSDKVTLAGRTYDFAIDRDAQILWAGDPDPLRPGFPGRWGPITEDYNTLVIPPIPSPAPRRSGMRFPKFWHMFFSELVASNPVIPTKQYLIDRAEGTPIGNATSGGGLAAAYDGDTSQVFTASPFSNAAPAVFNGKRFPTPYRISGIRLWLTSDFGLNNNTGAMRVCTVYGKSGADPATPTDGTQVFTFTVTDTAGASFSFLTGFNTAAAFDRIWVAVANAGTNIAVFSEIEWYQDSV